MAKIPDKSSKSELGARGLVVVRNADSYSIIAEEDWRKLDSYPVAKQDDKLEQLSTLHVSLARLKNSVFVDFDQLKQLEETPGSIESAKTKPTKSDAIKITNEVTVIIKESDKLFVVPLKKMKAVNSAITGDAAVLVARDVVLAATPESPIPSGTFCVLINFMGIAGDGAE